MINGIIGACCLVGFLFFRTFMRQYQLRHHVPHVTLRPPPMPTGAARAFSWIEPVFATSDGERELERET